MVTEPDSDEQIVQRRRPARSFGQLTLLRSLLQFRSQALPDGEMKGYQADIGPDWWGKLYEEHGRGLLWPKSGEAHVKDGEWNDYVIEAAGTRVRTWINGQACVDLDDPAGAKSGLIAFQLHSGGPTEVRFKDLRLEPK